MLTGQLTTLRSLLRDLTTTDVSGPCFTVYMPAGTDERELDMELERARASSSGVASTSMLVQAVLRHVRGVLLEDHVRAGHSRVCFAAIDGSAHGDIWATIPAHMPLQAYVEPRFQLAPLVAMVDRIETVLAAADGPCEVGRELSGAAWSVPCVQ